MFSLLWCEISVHCSVRTTEQSLKSLVLMTLASRQCQEAPTASIHQAWNNIMAQTEWPLDRLESCAYIYLTFVLLSAVDNFCKQFGPRSGPTKRWS